MSMFTIVSADQAREALQDLAMQLSKSFNDAARSELFTKRMRVARISTAEWGVEVDLKRAPTVEEDAKLPKIVDNVKISYLVVR